MGSACYREDGSPQARRSQEYVCGDCAVTFLGEANSSARLEDDKFDEDGRPGRKEGVVILRSLHAYNHARALHDADSFQKRVRTLLEVHVDTRHSIACISASSLHVRRRLLLISQRSRLHPMREDKPHCVEGIDYLRRVEHTSSPADIARMPPRHIHNSEGPRL